MAPSERSLSAGTPRLALTPQLSSAPVSLGHVTALLAGLNREQRRAVTHAAGPQLVLAGPGTGKTEVITRRVAWLIATRRAKPREILALTFTQKAAFEMQARVDVLVPYGQADAQIQTFHAFGDRILREHAFELGLPGDVRLVSRSEAVLLLRQNLFALGLDRYRPLADPTRFLGTLVDLFSRAKDEGVLPQDFSDHVEALARRALSAPSEEREALADLASARTELARAYERYQALLAQRGLIDHADQVLLCLRLLRERPQVRRMLHDRFRHLLVDEFQDTNPTQLELALALTGPDRNVTVVGDDDQAIYSFRGAAISNMLRFAASHPDLSRVVLRRNYRSKLPILEASQRLIRHNDPGRMATMEGLDKRPIPQRRSRRPAAVRQLSFRTRDEEADAVAREIASRIGSGASPADFAVLVRTNGDAEAFLRSLLAHGVAARSSARQRLYERREVRTLLAFLRVVADPSSSTDLYALASSEPYLLGGQDLTSIMSMSRRRHRPLWEVLLELVEQPGVLRLERTTREALSRLVADVQAAIELSHQRSAGEVLYDFLKRSGRLARMVHADRAGDDASALADIARFFEIVRAQAGLLAEDRIPFLVPHLSELDEAGEGPEDAGPDAPEAVAVLTVHRAKGLEFPTVFVCGLADGRFPARSRPSALVLPAELCTLRGEPWEEDQLAEERRLCYVAMTRARDELSLSYSCEGPGGRSPRRPSPFLAEALDHPPTVVAAPAPVVSLMPPRQAVPLPPPRPAARPAAGALSLSFSQIEDYLGCPERYRLRQVVSVPTPVHHALAYGNALHQAVAAFHLRQGRGELMSEEALMAAFDAHWSAEGFLSREHEDARYLAGQAALRRFRSAELERPGATPVAIERPFAFAIGRDQIRGRIDRLDNTTQGVVITDYKSSDVRDQRRADQKARDSLQLQIYALAHEAETGELPAEVRLHFLDGGVVGSAVPERPRLERAAARITQAADGIRSGDYAARPNPIVCGYCPYRAVCAESAA